jgi:hypothetical protein
MAERPNQETYAASNWKLAVRLLMAPIMHLSIVIGFQ